MTEFSDDQLTYAEKIAKMLRLAENASTAEEAEAFTAKAQHLMIKYAISEELLAKANGTQLQDKIVKDMIAYTGIFHGALFDIGRSIALNNDIKHLIDRVTGKSQTNIILIGFSRDIAAMKVLDASLQIQASAAMQRWYRQQNVAGYTPMQKAKMRREFLFGFARGLNVKLATARRNGIAAAQEDEAKRTGDAAGAKQATELVLVTKTRQVQDWMDNEYGKSLRSVKRRYTSGGYEASRAGQIAGMNAVLRNKGIGETRGQISGR
jgi:hypothetical protein